jgi:hypothetical protein
MSRKPFSLFYSPIFFGVVAGAIAVLAHPLFKIHPPQAYGICTVCHARDLINWISNLLFSTDFEVADAAATYPLLTTIGIIIGSSISSKLNNELKLIKAQNLIVMFILGFIIANLGLTIISCPTRLVLRTAYGDPFAFISLIGLIAGIFAAVMFLKWRAR